MKHLSTFIAAALFTSGAFAADWNHVINDNENGPYYWGTVDWEFATCGSRYDPISDETTDDAVQQVGKKQTPINIIPANAVEENTTRNVMPEYEATEAS